MGFLYLLLCKAHGLVSPSSYLSETWEQNNDIAYWLVSEAEVNPHNQSREKLKKSLEHSLIPPLLLWCLCVTVTPLCPFNCLSVVFPDLLLMKSVFQIKLHWLVS